MKMRSGFVSNSSSSSFVIAAQEKAQGKFTVTLEADISSFAKAFYNAEELGEYVLEEYGYQQTLSEILEEDSYIKAWYDKAVIALSEGKVIWVGSASYNETENPVELMIGTGGLKYVTNIEILEAD